MKKALQHMKSLVIVESPAKAKTIGKYLGKDYTVKASVGHIMDLPKSKLGVDVEKDFEPRYIVIKGKAPIVKELKAAAKKADRVLLATDPDREGEAIAAHVAEAITGSVKNNKEVYRVLFNEITKKAILLAIEHPGKIDTNKVDAQQARRVLDRLVGYQISPILWKKVRRGLSAGRVQSVALRLICEREEEIKAFIPEEFWSLTALLEGKLPPQFEAKLIKKDEEKLRVKNNDEVKTILAGLEGKAYTVAKVEKKERRRNPVPPFTTSKLQQEGGRKLGFTAKRTMGIAQSLYEGVDVGEEGTVGLITYMRTDSTRVGKEAQDEARELIAGKFGKDYVPEKPPVYASSKSAQEAHEAVRPTSVMREPDAIKQYLEPNQYKLYKLIWNRFVASQMNPAVIDQTSVDIKAGEYTFRATGSVVKFPGFMAVYMEEKPEDQASDDENEEAVLPPLSEGETLALIKLDPKQHFTQPPPRFSEALLVKTLEEKGIGRPSTYAAIISTIQERDYVTKVENKFRPTELGVLVSDLLVNHFPVVMDVAFTAKMEEELDKIEEGEMPWVEAVKDFYKPFSESLEKAQVEMRDVKAEQPPTDIACEKCGKLMVIKWGRNGQFLACSGYPECKNTKPFIRKENGEVEAAPEETTDETCPKCNAPMVFKRGRFGKFLACSRYPECNHTQGISTGVACPEDGGKLVERRSRYGKVFYSCSNYPECKFAIWYKPVQRPCPQCNAPFLVEKYSKKTGPYIACLKKECGYKEEAKTEAPAQDPKAGGEI